jgi:hypothetical protein
LIFGNSPQAVTAALSGALGGMFPDGLSFVYYSMFKKEPLFSLERFHKNIQKNGRFQERPVPGITLQILILAAVVGAHFLINALNY